MRVGLMVLALVLVPVGVALVVSGGWTGLLLAWVASSISAACAWAACGLYSTGRRR